MANVCEDWVPESFWRKAYNLSSGEGYRLTAWEQTDMLMEPFGITLKDLFDANMIAQYNFHGHYFSDGKDLDDILHFRCIPADEYWGGVVDEMRRMAANPMIRAMFPTAEQMKEHNIEYSVDGNTVTVLGVAAHASLPDAGVNAINHLMEALYVADFHDPFVDYIHKYIGLELHGETLGLDALKDETNSSVNLGVIGKNGDNVECTLDIRFPITRKDVEIAEVLNKAVADDCGIRLDYNINPLYYDKNSKLVQSLLKAYRSIVDDQRDMIAIGGGTYAKSMNNIIAFGCAFNEEENHIHDANESLSIEEFKKQVEIYIEAIKNLNEA